MKVPYGLNASKVLCFHRARLEKVISRRTLLALPFAAACTRPQEGFRGYAFIANQEGEAVAAVDLGVLAVARHIPLQGAPSQVIAATERPLVYALTPETGSVHEIQIDNLRLSRKLTLASQAITMELSTDEKSLYVLAREPRALVSVALDTFQVEWKLPLPDEPVGLAVSPDASDGVTAAVSSTRAVHLVDLTARRLSAPLGQGDYGPIQFLKDGKTLVAANRGERMLSVYSVAAQRLISHLPVAVRPDQFCFSRDGGQLFVTGEGMDAVVVVYPFFIPEVGDTVLAGHAPGAMDVSKDLLFVASPQSGDVSILSIASRKVIAIVPVGSDPGFIRVTPDDQYALILNRKSGDVAILSVPAITKKKNKYKTAALLTVIPVGSRPVSAAVRAV
jgi:YVTN family beta-propeller protein